MPILSRQRPPVMGEAGLLLNEVELPSKHRVLSPDEPPNASQKSDSECQTLASLDDDAGGPGSANGEFCMETLLQESQTCLQKFWLETLAREEAADETVELHRLGTVASVGPVLNNSAEYGSHL